MDAVKKPTPQEVRDYMNGRAASKQPIPSQAEIRRQLGWDLIEQERRDRERHPK